MIRVAALLFAVVALTVRLCCAAPKEGASLSEPQKTRLVVMTDISTLVAGHGEPDDTQSLIRLLLYANEFDIEGLIATITNREGDVHPEYIRSILGEYAKVRDNLARHDSRFPTAESLLKTVKGGTCGHEEIGEGMDSEGSGWIISVVDRPDPRPVWFVIWGGPRELAQALSKVERERSKEQFAAFVAKIRVHAIADQDPTGPWIKERFPDLFYITSKLVFRGLYRHGDTALTGPEWVDANLIKGHGPLGAAYPNYNGGDPWGKVRGIKEGDTASFLYLVPNGLSDPMKPEWGGWGGRFQGNGKHFTDAEDNCHGETSPQATVFRWRTEIQNDFAARMDWCVKPPKEANHPPCAVLDGDQMRTVKPGETVKLSAAGSTDPDDDSLSYEWSLYLEAGTWKGPLTIENAGSREASFVAPKTEKPVDIHIILKVTDDGTPPLSRYGRVVVRVE